MEFNDSTLNFFTKRNVGKQLRSLYIFTIMIPVLLIGIIIYVFSYRQITENYKHLSALKARQAQSVLTLSLIHI